MSTPSTAVPVGAPSSVFICETVKAGHSPTGTLLMESLEATGAKSMPFGPLIVPPAPVVDVTWPVVEVVVPEAVVVVEPCVVVVPLPPAVVVVVPGATVVVVPPPADVVVVVPPGEVVVVVGLPMVRPLGNVEDIVWAAL